MSCLFTPLTEGRSARDLTQAATSQKKNYHMGMDQLCQPAVLHHKDLVPSLWLAAFAALIGTSLTNEHNALLQHPLIPPQFPSRVIAPLLGGTSTQLRTTSLKSSPALVPRGPSKTGVPASRVLNLPLRMHPFESSLVPLWILSLPGLTIFLLGSPSWQFSSTTHRT